MSRTGRCAPGTGITFDHPEFKLPDDEHFFVTLEGRRSNLFGWVTTVGEPLSVEELMAADHASLREKLGDDAEFETPARDDHKAYLESVARHPEGTSMACDFLETRLPGGRAEAERAQGVLLQQDERHVTGAVGDHASGTWR